MSSNLSFNKNCEYCGLQFEAKTLYTRYCSHTCNRKHYKLLKRDEKIQSFQEVQTKPEQKTSAFNSSIQQKEFLSLDETATLLGTCKRTIQRMVSKGSLKVCKLGSRAIIKRIEIDKLFI